MLYHSQKVGYRKRDRMIYSYPCYQCMYIATEVCESDKSSRLLSADWWFPSMNRTDIPEKLI